MMPGSNEHPVSRGNPPRPAPYIWLAFAAGFATAAVVLAGVSCSWVRSVTGFGGVGPTAQTTPPASYQTDEGEPIIRVRLERNARRAAIDGPAVVRLAQINPPGALRARTGTRRGSLSGTLATPVTVDVSGSAWRIEDASGGVTLIPRRGNTPHDDALRFAAADGVTPITVSINPPPAYRAQRARRGPKKSSSCPASSGFTGAALAA